MSTRFFTSDDATLHAESPYIKEILDEDRDKAAWVMTHPVSYPVNYEAIEFTDRQERLFCRKLRLIDPWGGIWLIESDWDRPTDEAERHYVKQLQHMSFPQILEYEASTPLPWIQSE